MPRCPENPVALSRSSPPPPCGRNEVERGGEGGRGADFEDVAVAVRGQLVVALLALRKETRSRAAGRADAGQTET